MKEKTLYLTSLDYITFEPIRSIFHYEWVKLGTDNLLMANVDPPVDVSRVEFIERAYRTSLYLVNRFGDQTDSFMSLSDFPIHVLAFALKLDGDIIPETHEDLVNLGWAELYDNLTDAENHL